MKYLYAILAIIGALFSLLLYGRKTGKESAENKTLKQNAHDNEKAKDARDDVNSLSDSDVDNELRENYTRD